RRSSEDHPLFCSRLCRPDGKRSRQGGRPHASQWNSRRLCGGDEGWGNRGVQSAGVGESAWGVPARPPCAKPFGYSATLTSCTILHSKRSPPWTPERTTVLSYSTSI